MLTKCNENCIETIDAAGGISQEIPCNDSVRSNCVILGEDLDLCSIDVKSTDSLKKIIVAFDKVICGLKNSTIDIFFNDLVVDSCITKEIITDINNHKTIKLSIDENCLCNTIQSCNTTATSPFIVSASKYSICNNQSTTLYSIYSDTIWYNQSGVEIGTGASKIVSTGGNYYAVHQGKVSNIISVVYNTNCQIYSYTKVKNFYRDCPSGTNSSEYTYSKVYTSDTSYQDALHQADLDSITFDSQGQAIVNATGICISDSGTGGTTPVSNCFNVFLSNVNCNITPTPTGSCNISLTISSINCTNAPVPTTPVPSSSPSPTPIVIPTPTPVSNGVIITEPSKPQYYFSDGHSPSYYNGNTVPAIITNSNTFNPIDDVVYIENSLVKYGINLKRGGQLCYASLAGSSDNVIYNGGDGGFQVVLDAYQKPDGYTQAGQISGSPQNTTAYNTTMGGDYLNHSQTLYDYHAVTNGYYVKFRPLLYPFDALFAEVVIEATYTLEGRSLKIDYNYTSFRTDNQIPTDMTIVGWGVPSCFLIERLNKLQTYVGGSPFTQGTIVEADIPNVTDGGSQYAANSTEFYGLSYDPGTNLGFGAYGQQSGDTTSLFYWNQQNKHVGNPQGTVFSGAYTFMNRALTLSIPANTGNYSKALTCYVAIGSPEEIRNDFYTKHT